MNENNEKKIMRSIAEAHLYIAIAKADNNISGRELTEASNLAKNNQRSLNILNMNQNVETTIDKHINSIVRDVEYSSWDWNSHLDKSLSIFRELLDRGEWSVKLTADKIEDSLRKLSWVDGYDLHELQVVEKILSKLRELNKK